MKILLTTHQFLPDYSSGTEILTFDTAKEFKRAGHNVSVFTGYPANKDLDDASRFDSYEYEGINVHRFHHAFVPMGDQSNVLEIEYNNKFFASHFRKFLLTEKPDIVHFFHLYRLSASAITVCKELKIHMVLTPTDFWFVCPTCQLWMPDNSLCLGSYNNYLNCIKHYVAVTQTEEIKNKIEKIPNWVFNLMVWSINRGMFSSKWYSPYVRALSKRPAFLMTQMNLLDRVLFPTKLMGTILKKNGLSPEIMTYNPYGINFENLTKNTEKGRTEKLRLGFIGTLYDHKGAHILINAIRSLHNYKHIELKIYGKLEDFPEYVSKLYMLADNDNRISFLGTFPNKEIGKIFSALDALVVPSIWYENTPLVIYSAQAAGCPVIASNLGGMSEVVVDGENGLLFQAGDSESLASRISEIYHNRDVLSALAKNARQPKAVAEYAVELLNIYNEL